MKKILLILFMVLVVQSFAQSSLPKAVTDSLWAVWEDKSETDTNRLKAMHKIAWEGYLFNQPDSAFYFAGLKYELAKKKNLQKPMANALNTQGISLYLRGDYKKAIDYLNQCLEIRKKALESAKQEGDPEKVRAGKKGMAIALANIGLVFANQGDYAKAIEYNMRSLKMKKGGEKSSIATSLGNIGLIYANQGNYAKALDFYTRSLKIEKETGNKKGIAGVLNNMGNAYFSQDNYTKAIGYYQRSLKIREEIKDKRGRATSLNNIGMIYQNQGKYSQAIKYHNQSLKIKEEVGDKKGQATSLNNIGIIYQYQADSASNAGNKSLASKKYDKGLSYSLKSLKIAKQIGAPSEVEASSEALYNTYKNTGKNKLALEMYELYIKTRDSIQSEKNQKEVIRQEFKYEYEKQATADSIKAAEAKKVSDAKIAAKQAQLEQEKTQRHALYGGVALLLFFGGFMFNRFRVTRKQKEVIERQKEEVEIQKKEADQQRNIVEAKNKEITDSINYARRLQEAILPPKALVTKWLPDSFILFKPKDVVSGDFYWMEKAPPNLPIGEDLRGALVFFAVADCTGHGVPGAMVSVVCSNALSKAVVEEGISEPGKILERTRELVIERFGKNDKDIKDGMDIALCSLNTQTQTLKYSGANNPLWLIGKGKRDIEEIKADKQPIGRYATSNPFTTHEISLNPGDTIYIFSDGFPDQFGGPNGKKFKPAGFKKLLLSIRDKSMAEQKDLINKEFENWKGNLDQLDDVCVIGLRV